MYSTQAASGCCAFLHPMPTHVRTPGTAQQLAEIAPHDSSQGALRHELVALSQLAALPLLRSRFIACCLAPVSAPPRALHAPAPVLQLLTQALAARVPHTSREPRGCCSTSW